MPPGLLARTITIPRGCALQFIVKVATDSRTSQYEQAYEQTAPYMSDPGPSNTPDAEPVPATEPPNSTPVEADKARGRKRAKTQVNVVFWKLCF